MTGPTGGRVAAVRRGRLMSGAVCGLSQRVGVLLLVAAVELLGASSAYAFSETVSTPGCAPVTLPAGVTSVVVTATGSAGQAGGGGSGVGGTGDVVSGTVSGLAATGQMLDVCVDYGGGGVGGPGEAGGVGGGASGVALGSSLAGGDFLNPVVIAAGGGGGGGNEFYTGGDGGHAGMPSGAVGDEGSPGGGDGGGGGTQTGYGAAAPGAFAGSSGSSSDAAGPGSGGGGGAGAVGGPPPPGAGGGGGGAGYNGGGGGSGSGNTGPGGGGGGGSDFCASVFPGDVALSGCAVTGSNAVYGTASVTLSWQTTPTITWADPAPITYGTPLSAAQLDATAATAGTFAYTPSAGTVLNAGANQTLSVVFTPTDTTDYTDATDSVQITVQKAPTKLSAPKLSLGVITATLTRSDTHAPVPGEMVTFTSDNKTLCSATTNASGVATCKCSPTNAANALLFGYRANFSGDPNYFPSSTTAGP